MNRDKIISLAQEIIHEASQSEENAISNFQIEVTDSQIICTWKAHGRGKMDLKFYAEGVHSPWSLSVRDFNHNPLIEDERFHISIVREAIWHARALVDGEKQGEDTGSNVSEPEEPEPEQEWKPSFEVVVGDVKGCYNVHGITDDQSLEPPSLKEEDWEIITDTHNPVVHHSETVGGRKIDPVGFYLSKSGLNLFYNSGWDNYDRWFELREERGYRGATNQAGSLFSFSDDFSKKKEHPESPVLDQPQRNWQGRNRVNPYALVYHEIEKQFYCFYGDFAEGGDCDKYKGRRALGCARSKDMVNWEYLSVDKPMLDIKDIYDLDSEPFPNNNFCNQGRLYAFGATWENDQIYLNIGGSIDGTNWSTIIRSREPMDYWKPVSGNVGRPMAIRVKGKWYRPQNVGTEGGGRGIAIAVSEDVRDRGENHLIFDTGHGGSAGVSRQLFAYKGKWHVAYRQRDEKQWAEEREDYRDMYIAREK